MTEKVLKKEHCVGCKMHMTDGICEWLAERIHIGKAKKPNYDTINQCIGGNEKRKAYIEHLVDSKHGFKPEEIDIEILNVIFGEKIDIIRQLIIEFTCPWDFDGDCHRTEPFLKCKTYIGCVYYERWIKSI